MAHCSGGPGLNTVKAFSPLVAWVEKGVPPARLTAERVKRGVLKITRPVCAYPQVSHYDGIGNAADASSFACAPPKFEKDAREN